MTNRYLSEKEFVALSQIAEHCLEATVIILAIIGMVLSLLA